MDDWFQIYSARNPLMTRHYIKETALIQNAIWFSAFLIKAYAFREQVLFLLVKYKDSALIP